MRQNDATIPQYKTLDQSLLIKKMKCDGNENLLVLPEQWGGPGLSRLTILLNVAQSTA